MAKTKYQSIGDYIATFPGDVQDRSLERIRQTIREVAPDAKEVISYKMPAFRQQGILVYFAAHTKQIGFYPVINHTLNVETKGRKLVLSRVFDEPKDLLFQMWSDCEHLRHWGPMDVCTLDFREGGEWFYRLCGPNEGDESWGKAIYQEIDEPGKLVYKDYFSDSNGTVNEEMPEMLVTVKFVAQNGQTKMIQTAQVNSPETRDSVVDMGFVEGMNSSLDRMEDHLAEWVEIHNQ